MPIAFPTDPDFFEGLTKYQSTVNLERWFCSICGASVCNYDRSDEEWEFCTGGIDVLGDTKAGDGCLDGKLNRAYVWVHDTVDGGGVSWLNEGEAKGLDARCRKGRDSEQMTDETLAEMEKHGSKLAASKRADKLICRRHCGDVQLDILDPEDDEKYGGLLCACRTCRKSSGFEITSWAHVPRANLTVEVDDPSLGRYHSSHDRQSYFCKSCGATVMFVDDELATVAVAIGILDPEAGARAEAWLTWDPRVDGVRFLEEAPDRNFTRKLAASIQQKTLA